MSKAKIDKKVALREEVIVARPAHLLVGDKIIISNVRRAVIESLKPGIAGVMCPLITGHYEGDIKGDFSLDTGSNLRLQDAEFSVIRMVP